MDSVIKEGSHDVAWNDPPQFSYSGNNDKRCPAARIGLHSSSPYTLAAPRQERPDLEDDKNAPVPELQAISDGLKALLTNSHVDEKKKRDILRRIDTMEKKWASGDLNDVVMRGVGRILELLSNRAFEDALKVQTRLSVDWPGLVNPWGVGINQLILLFSQ
uniref:Steroid receptor RNA activator 1 n=1 Tax=Caligus clemensi TaxID=344056 RepID=C1C359_CALCM|nr:Steroid receptor RNA activator 1 [Caligus clemensi]